MKKKPLNIFHEIEREVWDPDQDQRPGSACRCTCGGCCCGRILAEMPRTEGGDDGTEAAKA